MEGGGGEIKLQQQSFAHCPAEKSKGITVFYDDDESESASDDDTGIEYLSESSSQFPLNREEFAKIAYEKGIRLQKLSLARRSNGKSRSNGIAVLCPNSVTYYNKGDDSALLARKERQIIAKQIRRKLTYDSTEKRTCIWSSGAHSWSDKSAGIMWVAVHGTDSICVITSANKPDVTRLSGFFKHTLESEVLRDFRGSVVYEVEGLAYSSSELPQLFDIKKPFGVVSVIPCTNNVNEESGHKGSSVNYYEENAIKFIREKLKSGSDFSYDETIRTAIAAFQHLFGRKFVAEEIKVCVWKKNWRPYDLFTNVVEEHLSVINA